MPGDLLFAIAVDRYGLSQSMNFQFKDLLKAGVKVIYPRAEAQSGAEVVVTNQNAKPVLNIVRNGASSQNSSQIESLVRHYVAFSGHNFPDILVPLMRAEGVMFNPKRPLVIYQSMQLEFDHFRFASVELELTESHLAVSGKRGDATLDFSLFENETHIGHGHKKLVLSGLREYDEEAIQHMRMEYQRSKLANSNQNDLGE